MPFQLPPYTQALKHWVLLSTSIRQKCAAANSTKKVGLKASTCMDTLMLYACMGKQGKPP